MAARKYDYDLVVIGGGSGGMEALWHAAKTYKKKVAVIEPQAHHGPPHYSALGGTCVNVGCVPKKLYVIGAAFGRAIRYARGFGWKSGDAEHDWAALQRAKDAHIASLNKSYAGMLEDCAAELLLGFGRLEDAHTIAIGAEKGAPTVSRRVTAENILLSNGGWPSVPRLPGIERAVTSNEVFYWPSLPRRVCVVGGGYIAVEFGCMLAAYGAHVTLAYRGAHILRGFDAPTAAHLQEALGRTPNLTLRLNAPPAAIRAAASGDGHVVEFAPGGGDPVECDAVIFATGRTPAVQGLGLEAAGVAVAASGGVAVDAFSRTCVPSVWAIGDVTNRVQLTPVAIMEGQCAVASMFSAAPRAPCYDAIAKAVFSDPPIGTVGPTEAEAAAAYAHVQVYQTSFTPLAMQLAGAAQPTLMRVLVDGLTRRVVAAHMCGLDAPEVIQPLAVAIKAGVTKDVWDTTVGLHPTSAEDFFSMREPAYEIVCGHRRDCGAPLAAADPAGDAAKGGGKARGGGDA